MRPKPNNLDLHAMASALLRDHASLTKQINWLMQRRIEIETRLEEIDYQLGNTPNLRSPVLRIDSQGRGAE